MTKSDPNIYTKTHQIAPFKKNYGGHAPEPTQQRACLPCAAC